MPPTDLLTPTQKGQGLLTPQDPVRGGTMAGSTLKGGLRFRCDPTAGLGASEALCEGLVAELNALQGSQDAALWAFRERLQRSQAGGLPGPGPRPGPLRRQASLPNLRSPALRCPSSEL